MRFLVDTNTFRHPAVSGWEPQEDQLLMWGPVLIASRHYKWRFRPAVSPAIAREIPFVPALGLEGRDKGLSFFTYQLLEYESWTVRPAVDWARRSIPDLFELQRLRPQYEYNGILFGDGVDLLGVVRRFIDDIDEPRLKQIKAILGSKHTQDAFHLFVCEEQGLDGFVTLDLKLKKKYEQSKARLKSPAQILIPSEVARAFDIAPVDEAWFAAGEDDVRADRIVQLFSRTATRRDKLIFAAYRALMYLRKIFAVEAKFVIPGY